MNTSEMVRELCKAMNISLAELARRLQQSPQNLFKKIMRDSLSLEELMSIADILGVRFEQAFVLPNGKYFSTANARSNRKRFVCCGGWCWNKG